MIVKIIKKQIKKNFLKIKNIIKLIKIKKIRWSKPSTGWAIPEIKPSNNVFGVCPSIKWWANDNFVKKKFVIIIA